jgi:shikimate dehydrogenase
VAHAQTWVSRLQGLPFGEVSGLDLGALTPVTVGHFDIVVNATPVGMTGFVSTHNTPMALDCLAAHQVVADVITLPVITPLIAHARSLACATVTGADMFAQVRELMAAFFVAADLTIARP